MTSEKQAKNQRWLDRIDKRTVRKIKLRKVRLTVYLTPDIVNRLDTNRVGMGMSRSVFAQYCIKKTTDPYERTRAARYQEARDAEA